MVGSSTDSQESDQFRDNPVLGAGAGRALRFAFPKLLMGKDLEA